MKAVFIILTLYTFVLQFVGFFFEAHPICAVEFLDGFCFNVLDLAACFDYSNTVFNFRSAENRGIT